MKNDGMSVVVTNMNIFLVPRRKFTEIIKELGGNGGKVCLGMLQASSGASNIRQS